MSRVNYDQDFIDPNAHDDYRGPMLRTLNLNSTALEARAVMEMQYFNSRQ
jgi:hypothetical protein